MTSTYNAVKDKLKDVITTSTDVEELRVTCHLLLNMIEELVGINQKITTEVQELRDEINRLKGEHGTPKFKARNPSPSDHSSEGERSNSGNDNNAGKKKKSTSKKLRLKITREAICPVDKSQLPPDAVFKGYQSVVSQDIIISSDNVEFKKEVYYSPSLGKNFTGSLPNGYSGGYGPNIKALVLSLHNASNMTESAIVEFLTTHGVIISSATVARIILSGYDQFKEEKASIIDAGLSTTLYHHIDDTGAKVDGKQYYNHVLCNPFYTAYFTRPDKSRRTILEILSGDNLEFQFDDKAYELMRSLQLSALAVSELRSRINSTEKLNKEQLMAILDELYPNSPRRRKIITEASAISAYQSREDAIKILVCDDAPQFKQITQNLALCWVHEGRHYKKLTPLVPEYREEVAMFLAKFWHYYRELLEFQTAPSDEKAVQLSADFDKLFSTPVQYRALLGCMENTAAKKQELLTVLRYPDSPLHNNPAEHGARSQARKRDISFQTKTETGTLAKDAMMTLVQTARKLGVNIYHYLHDRISQAMTMPSLADEIISRSLMA
jgi:hypothetical protein